MTAIIAYNNLLEGAALTTTGVDDADNPLANIANGLPMDYWETRNSTNDYIYADLGTAQAVDYWAIYGHDVAGITPGLRLHHSNNGSNYTAYNSYLAPVNGRPSMQRGATVNARYWRILLDSGSARIKRLAVVTVGKRLDLPTGMQVGFVPPWLGVKVKHQSQLSSSGQFIGRSVKRLEYQTDIALQHLEPAWVRNELAPFLEHAQSKPFVFFWDYDNYPDEGAYCWLRDNPTSNYSTTVHMSVTLPVSCSL